MRARDAKFLELGQPLGLKLFVFECKAERRSHLGRDLADSGRM
jgi:hypothetical protein